MFAIDNATAATLRPTPGPAGTPGYFTGGDPAGPTAPTVVDADWLNRLQVELLTVIIAAGITPSKTDSTQVLQALYKILSAYTGRFHAYAGDPNGHLAGTAGSAGPPEALADLCVDVTTGNIYVCTATGSASTAVWYSGVASNYWSDTGAANALAIAPSPAIAAYALKQRFTIKVANTTTIDGATLNVSGKGPKALLTRDGLPIPKGELAADAIIAVFYDGTNFIWLDSFNDPTPPFADRSTRIPNTAWVGAELDARVSNSRLYFFAQL